MKRPALMFPVGALFGIGLVCLGWNLWGFERRPELVAGVVWEQTSASGYVARLEKRSSAGDRCEMRMTVSRDGHHNSWETDSVFYVGCAQPVELAWTGDNELNVKYSFDSEGFSHTTRMFKSKDGGVKINYFLVQ